MSSHQIKVGLFVLIGVAVLSVLVFMVGDERHMFNSQSHLRASFRDVAGLKVGSPVRMGGVDVGTVDEISFGATREDYRIHVRFTIVASQLSRVRSDSVVRIASKGLLGDKALDITMGHDARAVSEGGEVRSEESDDLGVMMRSAGEAMTRANEVLGNVATATRPLANPQLGNDIAAVVHDLRTISHQIAEGPGTAHQLLADGATAARIDRTLLALEAASARFVSTADHIDAIAREARTGHGLVHALVYDREGETMLRSLSNVSNEVAAITRDVRTGNGGLHQIIYGTDSAQAVANINQATASLRDVMTDVRAGRGTIGALLTDPSLYEDLKSIVGNVQRNEILRAMVRYSIHQDEAPRAPVAPRPAAAPAATPRR
jgi:phospholipid/cholesterol/gamma-HCH transport system substrate-binding protein